jgi:hypothetical protein
MQTLNVSEKNAVSIFRAEGQGWEVMTYRIWGSQLLRHFSPEDGDSMLLRNGGIDLRHHTTPKPKTTLTIWKPHRSHDRHVAVYIPRKVSTEGAYFCRHDFRTLYWRGCSHLTNLCTYHAVITKSKKVCSTTRHEDTWGRGGEQASTHPLYLGTRWELVSVTPRPRFITGKGPSVPIGQETAWDAEPVWTQRLGQNPLPGIESRSPSP